MSTACSVSPARVVTESKKDEINELVACVAVYEAAMLVLLAWIRRSREIRKCSRIQERYI